MKSIVVISGQPIENNTSSMIRCRSILNGLSELGWKLTCYSPYPDKNNMYYDEATRIAPQIQVEHYGVPITSVKSIIEGRITIKKKIIRGLYYLLKKVDLFGSNIRYIKYRKDIYEKIRNQNYQIILSFSNPLSSHILAGYCKKKAGNLYYIQQWGDPLTENMADRTIVPKFIKRLIEEMLLRTADKICYVSPLTYERQKVLFKKYSSRMYFTPTPCERTEYPLYSNQKLTIGYLGSYNSVARDIRPFYRAACASKDFDFFIVGDSDVQLENTENVRIVKRLPQKELSKYIEKLDVLVCLMNSKGTQIPGKLYHYAGTDKEILVLRDGEYGEQIEAFFKAYNRYTFVENNEEKIAAALKRYAVNGLPRRCCVEEFCAENVAAKLIEGVNL